MYTFYSICNTSYETLFFFCLFLFQSKSCFTKSNLSLNLWVPFTIVPTNSITHMYFHVKLYYLQIEHYIRNDVTRFICCNMNESVKLLIITHSMS